MTFAELYQAQVSGVYGFFRYRHQSHELAEDLTQVTFEKALRAWSRYDPSRAGERTWLLAIARNVLTDHLRAHRETATEIPEHAHGSAPGAEQRYAGSGDLEAALGTLAERERELLALRFGADLTGPEIAALTGLSLANVQQIQSRALRELRRHLG